jgi:hypothetical protein
MSSADRQRRGTPTARCGVFGCLALMALTAAHAGDGRILATGGITQVEGAGGGGLVPWATLVGYSTDGQWDADASLSLVRTSDFRLTAASVGFSAGDRLELSLARQRLELDGAMRGDETELDILGAKFRLGGDLIYDRWPQLSLGLQYKRQHPSAPVKSLGLDNESDVDVYLAATRLYLDGPWHRNWLVNLSLRSTRAHQLGLLGFSGDRRVVPEISVVMLTNPRWAIGAEYRAKPDTLPGLSEDDWFDVFVGWFPNKRFSAALGYADLGQVGGLDDQRGLYLNLKWNP